MAYLSSTTTSPNVPYLVTQGITSSAVPRVWIYNSTHISSDIAAANFFTDGNELGMKVGDQLIHTESTVYLMTSHSVVAVGSTTTDIGVGTTIGLGS